MNSTLKKCINHVCSTCDHLRIKIGTEEHLDPIILVCGLTNEETTEWTTCPNWKIDVTY